MPQKSFLPILRVSGTNYEIGYQIGRNFKTRIKQAFAHSVRYKFLKEQDRLKPESFDRLHDYAKNYFPHYMDEISGIAEGSGQDYRDIALINFRGSFPIEKEGCSTVIFKKQDQIILAHNEDHETVLGELAYLLIVDLKEGLSFFAYTYPGCLPGFSFSFNSHGIVMSANAMPDPEVKIGVPRHLLDRSMLEATTIVDALQRAQISPRSGAFSYNLASMAEKKAVNLETTSEKAYVTEIHTSYFHTNHYISDGLKGIPISSGTSRNRYERGIELIPHATQKLVKEAFNIISDDKIFLAQQERTRTPYGNYQSGTLCTALFEITDDIVLRIYPTNQTIEDCMKFSLRDLA